LHRNDVSVAHAVAASAAYPLFLPAFDESLMFEKEGTIKLGRVLLTDGGLYDNLGLGCLWPDRSPDISLNVVAVDTIICCSAGYGLRQEPPSQFLFARMLSVVSTLFDRAQNAAMRSVPDRSRVSSSLIWGSGTAGCPIHLWTWYGAKKRIHTLRTSVR
jgi:NTE family protein